MADETESTETMSEENAEQSRMSFLDHLEELRSRLLRATLAIIAAFAVSLYFAEDLFSLLAAPLTKLLPTGFKLVYTSLPDPFFVYLKVSFVVGVFAVIPYVIYQLWAFIRPGLFPKERKLAVPFVILATSLFYLGAAFAYFLVFPAAFKFFLGFQTTELAPMINIRDYVSLAMVFLLAFCAIFETPIIIVFLGLIGLFDSGQLRRGRRYFIVIAFIIGAILTPTPDPFNQTLMAVPMLLLYEVGIRFLAIIERKRARDAQEEEQEHDQDKAAVP
jgi:sec-independent protein translocase protein TatC